ncbi:MAG TPA: hypothetical protein VND15_01725 [Candidatus Acidoferrales bacterium]|nr:hypothetical protein [Candidatus Acidoferrales bacterium]
MRRIVLLLIISTFAYTFLNIFGYAGLQHLSLGFYLMALGIGALVSALAIVRLEKLSFVRKNVKTFALELSGGAALAISSIGVYAIYRSSTLAGGQPLMGAAIIVFLAIDFIFFGKMMKRKESLWLVAGVLAVAIGIFVIQSNGFAFKFSILPILVFMMVSQGIGFYLFLYGVKRQNSATRLVAFPAFLMLIGLMCMALYNGPIWNGVSALPFGLVIMSGVLLSVAVGFEVISALPMKGESKWQDILGRNFVNNFTYMDIVFVMVWNVVVNAYTLQEIAGGLIILVGVLVLNKISK